MYTHWIGNWCCNSIVSQQFVIMNNGKEVATGVMTDLNEGLIRQR